MLNLDGILNLKPYSFSQKEKEKILFPYMKRAIEFHAQKSREFKKVIQSQQVDQKNLNSYENLPYLHISAFKKFNLLSVPKNKIKKILFSSGTSGTQSRIFLDAKTARYQTRTLVKILTNFIGNDRKLFLILDSRDTLNTPGGESFSRATAITSMYTFSNKIHFLLDSHLELNKSINTKNFEENFIGSNIVFFGFTWLVYTILNRNKAFLKSLFRKKITNDTIFLHIGGWKKLSILGISKKDFNHLISTTIGIKPERIIDLYGLTEQLGIIFPDCPYGFKHVPLYSEILCRDINTLQPVGLNRSGFLQSFTPITTSYPGISILTDDIISLKGIDNCPCGRKGKYFTFIKRPEGIDLRGCGDTLNI